MQEGDGELLETSEEEVRRVDEIDWDDGRYDSELANGGDDIPHDRACTYADGSKYDGDWIKGRKHGRGADERS